MVRFVVGVFAALIFMPARDLTRWVVGGGAAMILAASVMIVIFSTVLRRGKPRQSPLPAPPPRAARES